MQLHSNISFLGITIDGTWDFLFFIFLLLTFVIVIYLIPNDIVPFNNFIIIIIKVAFITCSITLAILWWGKERHS